MTGRRHGRALAAWSPGVLALLLATTVVATVAPGDLLIYYGWPSLVNGTGTTGAAATELARYDFVVLGDGLERPDHPDHANTVAIIAMVHAAADTRIYGYVDLGVITRNLSLAAIEEQIDLWLVAGVDGIFLDDFGYDFAVTRARQNAAVGLVHARGRGAIANGWLPEQVFGDRSDPVYNPDGLATELGAADFYLSESFQFGVGSYQDEGAWYAKTASLAGYQAELGFGILSVTTNDAANAYDGDAFAYAWYSALLCGHAAVGWGEFEFAAVSCSAPWRERPAVAPGTAFTSAILAAGPVYRRFTDTGRVEIDAATHVGAFRPLVSAVGTAADAPGSVAVRSAPNPLNPTTVITFELPRDARVTVAIHALDGRLVAVPLEAVALPAGAHRLPFDGSRLASGRYLCRVVADGAQGTASLTVLR